MKINFENPEKFKSSKEFIEENGYTFNYLKEFHNLKGKRKDIIETLNKDFIYLIRFNKWVYRNPILFLKMIVGF